MGTAMPRMKMSRRASVSGGGVKRKRQQQVEEDQPASVQVSAHAEPLTLLVMVKSFFGTLVWLQLCNPQGVALFSYVHVPPRVPRAFAGAPVYDLSLTHAERLRVVGCGFKGKLVRLLSLGVGRHFEPQRNWHASHKMMQRIARRVAAGLAAAVRDKAAKEAAELCAAGQCAAAVVPLQRAIDFGDLPSRALKAWLHIDGREGVAKDLEKTFELAEEAAALGCHHCQGVMSYCYAGGYGCKKDAARSLELARESSGRGSIYGQYTFGRLHHHGFDYGLSSEDYDISVPLVRLAAAQGLDGAQYELGCMHEYASGVAQSYAEALRWYKLAAAQGHPFASFTVAQYHEQGRRGVRKNNAAAIRWYRRAQVPGHPHAACKLQELSA